MINLAHNGTSIRAYALVWLTAACGSQPLSPAKGAAGTEGTVVTASSTVTHALESAGENATSGRGSQFPNVSGAAGAAAGVSGETAPDQQRQLGFHERFEGDVIVVDVTDSAGSGIFMQGCSSPTGLYQLADEAWIPVRDDRPPASGHGGYYLDDEYIVPGSETCDATRCDRFPSDKRIEVGETYEYVSAGTRAAPQDASGMSRQVPNINRRPLSGAVKIKITYFEDSACSTAVRHRVATRDSSALQRRLLSDRTRPMLQRRSRRRLGPDRRSVRAILAEIRRRVRAAQRSARLSAARRRRPSLLPLCGR